MKRTISKWKLAAIAGLFTGTMFAQVPEYQWVSGLNSTTAGAASNGNSVAVDILGNVYSCGDFEGTIDFDPGPGVYNMSATGWGIFVRKLDAAGNFLWARMVSNPSRMEALAITANETGVYTTGYFMGTADFDPGAAVLNRTTAGNQDLFALSLNSAGNYMGSYQLGGTGVDRGSSIAVRGSSLYVAGVFSGSCDANPSTFGVSTITSNGGIDICIVKIGTTGSFSWVRTMGSPSNDASSGAVGHDDLSIAVTIYGDIYTTGNSYAMDLDPTAGVFPLTGSGCFVQKLTNAGAFVWGNQLVATTARGICVDNADNVYTTGFFTTTTDFDPGAGIVNLNPGSNANAYVRKLDLNGNFGWAVQLGGTGFDKGHAVAAGPSGNIYVTGDFEFTADFDPSAGSALLTAAGVRDGFICGLDNSGAYLWAKRIGGTADDESYDIATDYAEAIYTCGIFKGVVDFNTEAGTYNLPLAGYVSSVTYDAYLHKLLANCTTTPLNPGFDWAMDMGGTGLAYGQAIETDSDGNVYSTGYFTGSIDFDPGAGTYILNALSGRDIYVQKQDASGNLLWVKQIMGKGDEYSYTLSLDGAGNVAIGGTFNDDVDADPGAGSNVYSTNGAQDILVVKLDASGNYLWSKHIGGTTADICNGINFDASGNLGCTGSFTGTVDFDPNAGVVNLTSAGQGDIYVLKLDVNGNWVWVSQHGGTSDETGKALCFDASGAAYVTGNFSGTTYFNYPSAGVMIATGGYDSYVMRVHNNGTYNWVRHIGGAGNDRATGIVLDETYNFVYATGLFSGTSDFNGTSLTSIGADDAFIFKLTTGGTSSWVKQIGELSGAVYTQAITTDDCGDVYITGHFLSSCDFDPNSGVYTLTPGGGAADVCIFKLQHTGGFCWAKRMGGNSTDNSYGIDVDANGNVYTTGYFQSTADYNPGAGVYNLVCSLGSADIFVHKLNINSPLRLAPESGMQAGNAEAMLNVFPNPSNGRFTVSFGAALSGKLEIFDAAGQLIQSIPVNETMQTEIDLENNAKGIYLLRFTNENQSEIKRIIVQ